MNKIVRIVFCGVILICVTTYPFNLEGFPIRLAQDVGSDRKPVMTSSNEITRCSKWHPGHYLLITRDTTRSEVEEILSNPNNYITGVQIGYYWYDLEPQKDKYDFSRIIAHLEAIKKYNKQLFISFMDRNFDPKDRSVPIYIINDPEYHGGVEPTNDGGFIARLWDPLVIQRSNKLIEEMGKHFDKDPNFEGINFDESSLNIDITKAHGYSHQAYADALKNRVDSAHKAFPTSTVIMYMNYGPPELLKVIEHMAKVGVGMGGPDLEPDKGLFPYRLRTPAFAYYPKYAGRIPLGTAIQYANMLRPDYFQEYCPSHPNAPLCRKDKRGNYVKRKGDFSLDGFWDMGLNTLKLNYFFWGMYNGREFKFQFYKDVLPSINSRKGEINKACPEIK